ncbi:hypothetical protein PAXINDRAFT_7621 [Paxillus involutus ATCC 200175]|nr:hypothetical protein PAXINDRAFT_7621 [Paxillus involutus ATCC 200175]
MHYAAPLLGAFDPDESPISVDIQASEPDAKAQVQRLFIPPAVPEDRESDGAAAAGEKTGLFQTYKVR